MQTIHVGVGPVSFDDLVRVSRELLTNVVRHAGATAVRVSVVPTDEGIRLEIADDGVGFDRRRVEDATRRGHVGLASVAERVRDVGGSTDLLDVAGGGALVRVVVPVGVVVDAGAGADAGCSRAASFALSCSS